jgi:hypothetical protein
MEQTLYFLFFLSGASSLIFETIFTRLLTYTYGNTAYAVSTVLAAFLGGLALGAFLLGRWVDRHPPSLWIYGGRQSNPDSAPAKRPGSGGDVRLGTPLFDKHVSYPDAQIGTEPMATDAAGSFSTNRHAGYPRHALSGVSGDLARNSVGHF